MENIKKSVLIIAFLLLPFSILTMGLIHLSHHYAIVLFMTLIMASYIRNNYLFFFGVFLVLWQTFIFLYAIGFPNMPQIIVANGFSTVIFVATGLTAYLAAAHSKLKKETFFNAMCIASIIQAFLAIVQWGFGVDILAIFAGLLAPTGHMLDIRVMIGSLGNPNFLAAFIAFTIPYFFRKGWIWTLPLLCFVLYNCMSSSAMFPALLGVGVFMWLKAEGSDNKRINESKFYIYRYYILTALFVVFASYFVIDRASIVSSERFIFWKEAIKQVSMFFPTFIFGMGPGALWARPHPMHSEWVSVFHQFGIVGLSLFIGFTVSVLRKIKDKYLIASFLIIIINLFANSALHYAPTAFLACMIAGLIEREVSWQNIKPSLISTKR